MLVDRVRGGDCRLGGDRERTAALDRPAYLRTADATSPVPGATIAGTLALFVIAYGIVFSFGIYYINRLIAKGMRPVWKRPEISGRFR